MSEPNGDHPNVVATIQVHLLDTGGVHLTIPPGLPADVLERCLYGALKYIERRVLIAELSQALNAGPRIMVPPGAGLPPGRGR